MKHNGKSKKRKIKHSLKSSFEVVIFPESILIFLRRSNDVIDAFVNELDSLGLKTKKDFKSPCG